MNNLQAFNTRVLLESMPLHIANGFSALHKYTSQTTDLLDDWHIDRSKKLEADLPLGWGNGSSLNMQSDLRIKLQSILFNSTFISCVSFFEYQFKTISEIAGIDYKHEELVEINSYIQKYHHFVSKILKLNLKPRKKQWASLWDHSEIRNLFVHEQAFILNKKSDLIKKIDKMKNVRLDRFEEIIEIEITDCKFIYEYIETAKDYLNFVCNEILKSLPNSGIINPRLK